MQAVRIRLLTGETEPWYRSVIVDFELDEELVVLAPEERDRERDEEDPQTNFGSPPERVDAPPEDADADLLPAPAFDQGSKLEVEISFPDGIRRFHSVVRRLDLKYGGALWIDWPAEGTRIQRRDYVRVDMGLRTLVSFHRKEGGLQKLAGVTLDFSAGGVRLKMPEPLEADLRIRMEIDAPSLKTQTVQGRVVRSGEIEKKLTEAQSYWVAVEFVGVDERLRKEMTQLVFDIERDQMRKSRS